MAQHLDWRGWYETNLASPFNLCKMTLRWTGVTVPRSAVNDTKGTAVFLYQAYGLKIASPVLLPALIPAEGSADVTISVSHAFEPRVSAQAEDWTYRIGADEAEISHPAACTFRVRAGREIEIIATPALDEHLLQVYIVGLLMAVLLYQRNYFVLHASSAELDGGAVAFLGQSGAGKSSLVASLHKRGAQVLADDNTAIEWTPGGPVVIPGFPELKVIPEIAGSLGYTSGELRPFHPALRKVGCSVETRHSASHVDLKQAYVLSRTADSSVRRLTKQEAIIELVRHSMPSRLGVRAGGGHLMQCIRLAELIPFFLVKTFDSLDEIPALAQRIEDHWTSEELVAS